RCAGATARVNDGVIVVDGGEPTSALRATAALGWHVVDGGGDVTRVVGLDSVAGSMPLH
ncbi:MAG: hypothetical protein QOG49_567, partial [Frankiaceae bacterium]|nr:hypothetical protein [Frankiaceae bacterium]